MKIMTREELLEEVLFDLLYYINYLSQSDRKIDPNHYSVQKAFKVIKEVA